MHKGRQYLLEPLARVYSGPASYPQWFAKQMTLEVNGWQGTYAASVSSNSCVADYEDTNRDLQLFRYIGEVPSTGGHTVEVELTLEANSDHTDMIPRWQVLYDGAPQMASPPAFSFFQKWKQGSAAFFLTPGVPGYQILPIGNFTATATPYPT